MLNERTLEDVLTDVKDVLLCYRVMLFYGQQEVGQDDTGMPREERKVAIVATPGGLLGECAIAFQGTVPELCAMDLFQRPKALSNPPTREELEESPYVLRSGAFVWGQMAAASRWPAKLKEREANR